MTWLAGPLTRFRSIAECWRPLQRIAASDRTCECVYTDFRARPHQMESPMLRLARAALQRLLPPGRQGASDRTSPVLPESVAPTPLGRSDPFGEPNTLLLRIMVVHLQTYSTDEHTVPDNVTRILRESPAVKYRAPFPIQSYSRLVHTSDMSPRPT